MNTTDNIRIGAINQKLIGVNEKLQHLGDNTQKIVEKTARLEGRIKILREELRAAYDALFQTYHTAKGNSVDNQKLESTDQTYLNIEVSKIAHQAIRKIQTSGLLH